MLISNQFVDYLEKGHTITGAYYARLLRKVRAAIKEERRRLLDRDSLLQQRQCASPQVHNSHFAVASARKCGFENLPHPAYSPDMASSDFHFFGNLEIKTKKNLQKKLRGRHFTRDNELMSAIESWFQDQLEEFLKQGIKALEHRWENCIVLNGAYVGK